MYLTIKVKYFFNIQHNVFVSATIKLEFLNNPWLCYYVSLNSTLAAMNLTYVCMGRIFFLTNVQLPQYTSRRLYLLLNDLSLDPLS